MTFLSPPENAKFKTLAVPRLKNIQFARRNLQPETNEETPKKTVSGGLGVCGEERGRGLCGGRCILSGCARARTIKEARRWLSGSGPSPSNAGSA